MTVFERKSLSPLKNSPFILNVNVKLTDTSETYTEYLEKKCGHLFRFPSFQGFHWLTPRLLVKTVCPYTLPFLFEDSRSVCWQLGLLFLFIEKLQQFLITCRYFWIWNNQLGQTAFEPEAYLVPCIHSVLQTSLIGLK